ncbi:hypothetical protein DPMN_142349 [Dreissena polymorpha]|uniref:Uncharacterized protein n=1 Tax=Dreissena polymorpha TaxID=45954 RepID=A0A9D4GB50_DREPO|nr:hypothetical protein DPMN_142349 [Dreissena polymorpha]
MDRFLTWVFALVFGKKRSASSVSCSCSDDNWKCNLQFYQCDEYEDKKCKVSTFFQHDELLSRFKAKLSDECVEKMWIYKSSLDITCSKCFCKHQYIVFQTKKWWYSLEKCQQFITVQQGSKQEMVKNKIFGKYRKSPKPHDGALNLRVDISVHSIITILHEQQELHKPYTVYENNCIRFVEEVCKSLSEDREQIHRNALFARKMFYEERNKMPRPVGSLESYYKWICEVVRKLLPNKIHPQHDVSDDSVQLIRISYGLL